MNKTTQGHSNAVGAAIEAVKIPRSLVALFYKYVSVLDPEKLCADQQALYLNFGFKGRVRISPEGINGTLEGTMESILSLKADHLDKSALLCDIDYKTSPSGATAAFDKLIVKVVPELVSLGTPLALIGGRRGVPLDPEAFHKLLVEREKDITLLDVRNTYEWKLGHFKGAKLPQIRNYSQFPNWVDSNLDRLKEKPVAMYCTGGIRCETAAAILRSRGVKSVFQLKGGIHRYLEAFDLASKPGGLYVGKNFTFDKRGVQILPSLPGNFKYGSNVVVGRCDRCGRPHDSYGSSGGNAAEGRKDRERQCCDICRSLVLICSECDGKTPFYCDDHREWRTATETWIDQHIASLKRKLSDPANKGRAKKSRRKGFHKRLAYAKAHLLRFKTSPQKEKTGQVAEG